MDVNHWYSAFRLRPTKRNEYKNGNSDTLSPGGEVRVRGILDANEHPPLQGILDEKQGVDKK